MPFTVERIHHPLYRQGKNMSTASRLTLLGTIVSTAGIVSFVHWAQTAEKAVVYPFPELEGNY
jgi:hypothetical protein